MAPKGGKGKGGGASDQTEPEHDAQWERSMKNRTWDRPVDALPDVSRWPTWGALRERLLCNCTEVKVVGSTSIKDGFVTELVKLSPQELTRLDFRSSNNMTKFVMSPMGSCPKLLTLDLSGCSTLDYVLCQNASVETIVLKNCEKLRTLLLQCRNLISLQLEGSPNLERVIVWSESLDELALSHCKNLQKLELYCPALIPQHTHLPPLAEPPPPPFQKADESRPFPPIAAMLREVTRDRQRKEEDFEKEMRSSFTGFNIDLQIPPLTLLAEAKRSHGGRAGDEG